MRMPRALALALVASTAAAVAAPQPPADEQKLERDIFRELVETNTSQSVGDTAAAARAMAARLVAAGLPKADVQVFEPAPKRGDLVARLRGTGKRKPLLLMAHIDVVEAKREDWSTDPYKLVEKDGFFYGRGTSDDKYMASAWVSALSRLARERYKPDRDLILVLETDEEISDANSYGIKWLIAQPQGPARRRATRSTRAAASARRTASRCGTASRRPRSCSRSSGSRSSNPGGHSSLPRKDNAIYELPTRSAGSRSTSSPSSSTTTTRAYFEKMATIEHRPDRRRHEGGARDAPRRARDRAAVGVAAVQRAATNDLRRDAPRGRPRRQRATADRARDGQLPHPARPHRRRDAEAAREGARGAEARRDARRPRHGEPAVGDRRRVSGRGDRAVAEVLAGRGDPSDDVDRRDRRPVPAQPRHPVLWPQRDGDGIFDEHRAHGQDERVPAVSFYDGQEYLYELVKQLSSTP